MHNEENIQQILYHPVDDVIPDDGDSEEDADIPDYDVPEEVAVAPVQRPRGAPLRLLQGHRLRILGEGTVYFTTSVVVSGIFQVHKQRMRNADAEELIYQEPGLQVEIAVSSTPRQKILTDKREKRIWEDGKLEGQYELLLLLKGKLSEDAMKDVLAAYGIDQRTMKRIEERRERGERLIGKKRGRKEGMCLKINVETTRRIKEMIVNEPTITQMRMVEILETESMENPNIVKMSQSSVSTVINKLGYRYLRISKAPVNRNTELARKKRVVWDDTFLQLSHARVQFVFVDESGFCLGMTRTRGYGVVGGTPEVVVQKIRNPNHTAIAAMIVGHQLVV